MLLLVAALALATRTFASAQNAPAPKPIVTSIDHVPMVELYDGGGGLPYLGRRAATTPATGRTRCARTLALYKDAVARGIAVFFITGRGEASREHTEHNLRAMGFDRFQALVLEPAGSTLSTVAYKSAARAAIEKQGYEVVANVGDQYSDLAGGHADLAFKLANRSTSCPESAAVGNQPLRGHVRARRRAAGAGCATAPRPSARASRPSGPG